ncbi:MAG: hypothetical protein A3F74_23445 [Betaproteobacteria bacterium RIFCSPLOWO2_12_FULL_62_58]|nr:MAG: hypothetical protein A3F74_23445 [Betaproteobacteria bacterium RIFCSPLOWO2_12_FULL_62_58]
MLTVMNLKKQYRHRTSEPGAGVMGISFDVPERAFFTLLGPSGCGKTTTLRCIAGLEEPDSGRIIIRGDEVYNSDTGRITPVNERGIGMVFQSYAVWPHMTVFENAAFPLRVAKRRRYSGKEIANRVKAVLEMVGLGGFEKRPSTMLSGGQQQRLAVARALVHQPTLLLLDEPLSNLDAALRHQMRSELKRLQKDTGVTTVYVTHDQSEALAISDTVAVMSKGLIVQVGNPTEIYNRPNTEFVAGFIGTINLLRGRLETDVNVPGIGAVETRLGPVHCSFMTSAKAGREIAMVCRPEDIVLVRADSTQASQLPKVNLFQGVVVESLFAGETTEYVIEMEGTCIRVHSRFDSALVAGKQVFIQMSPDRMVAIVEEGQYAQLSDDHRRTGT